MTYDCMLRICFKTFGALCIQMKDRTVSSKFLWVMIEHIFYVVMSYKWKYKLEVNFTNIISTSFLANLILSKNTNTVQKICVLQFPCKELLVKCWSNWHLHYVLFKRCIFFQLPNWLGRILSPKRMRSGQQDLFIIWICSRRWKHYKNQNTVPNVKKYFLDA